MTSRADWNASTDPETVAKRAGGRRRYNAWRRLRAEWRRIELRQRIGDLHRSGGFLFDHGTQAALARALNVHRSTICRDVRRLLQRDLELDTAREALAHLGFALIGGRVIPFGDLDGVLRNLWREHSDRLAELGKDASAEVLDSDPVLSALLRRIQARERAARRRVRRFHLALG